jgi:PleD family two-component response regulator
MAVLEEGKFDVVLLDLHMPSPDGIELARQMRRTESNRVTPIILISDDQRPSAMSIGFEAVQISFSTNQSIRIAY